MSQRQWFWLTPSRMSPDERPIRATGWSGGRERCKPRKISFFYHERGHMLGGVTQSNTGDRWFAFVCLPEDVYAEQAFWHRRDAKQWVETHPDRRRART